MTSTNTAFSATLASSASAGTYSVEVTQLAAAQTLLSPKVASKDTDLGDSSMSSRTITITQPGQKDPLKVTLASDKTSLADVRDAINAKQGSVANEMSVAPGDSELEKYISHDPLDSSTGMKVQVAAADAIVNINGIKITRSSNAITDAPEGVTLNLTKTNVGSPETL